MNVTAEDISARIEVQRLEGMRRLADWWLAQFQDPTHDPSNPTEGGEAFVFRSVMSAEALARNACPPITDELRGVFRAGFLRRAQPDGADAFWDKSIGTDYGPGLVLSETMEECGIPKVRAPWKTMSWAYGGGLVITVGIGHYRDVEATIYVAPVVEELAAMTDEAIAQIPDPSRHLQLAWMVKLAARVFLDRALATRGTDPERMAYVLDAIRRGRAAIEWGFYLLEVTSDDCAGIRARGWIGAKDATRVDVVAVAVFDCDRGDEDRTLPPWSRPDCMKCGHHQVVGGVCLSCAPLAEALAALKAAEEPTAELTDFDRGALAAIRTQETP